MNDLQEAKAMNDSDFSDWVEENKEELVYEWCDQLVDYPPSIYECVLDDDYEDAEEKYCCTLTIEEVCNDWLSDKWELMLEAGDEQ